MILVWSLRVSSCFTCSCFAAWGWVGAEGLPKHCDDSAKCLKEMLFSPAEVGSIAPAMSTCLYARVWYSFRSAGSACATLGAAALIAVPHCRYCAIIESRIRPEPTTL